MNLIEARKLAHLGWVRSPPRTGNEWQKVADGMFWIEESGQYTYDMTIDDLDAEDWEPKPPPAKPFEAWVWERGGVVYSAVPIELQQLGWRRIRMREVVE